MAHRKDTVMEEKIGEDAEPIVAVSKPVAVIKDNVGGGDEESDGAVAGPSSQGILIPCSLLY